MSTMRRNRNIERFWQFHRWLYQASGGRLGAKMMGHQVLLLHTLGRKSGVGRTNALFFFSDDERYVVIASHLGEPKHPAWYHNLMARPETTIQVGTRRLEVRGREAEGEERERIWDMVVAKDERYAEYQALTERKIPVIILEPINRV